MHIAEAQELPFMAAVPKREKGRMAKALDLVREFAALSKQYGSLIPAGLLPKLLNVSRQRVHQLIEEEKLPAIQFHGVSYIPEDALLQFLELDRKHGHHFKAPESYRELLKRSFKAGFGKDRLKQLPKTTA